MDHPRPWLRVGVVGAGRVGAVLGAALAAAGHRVVAVSAVSEASLERAATLLPDVPVHPVEEVVAAADLVLLAVPDDALTDLVAGLATTRVWRSGQIAAHTSGAHGLAPFAPAVDQGVIPLALHQFAKKYQVPCILVSLHWPTVIHDHLKDKAHGGPFDTPFQHACEVEASYSLALFPEFMDMKLAVDTKPWS